jgi:hypothetical protein
MPTYAPPATTVDGRKFTVHYLINHPEVLQRVVQTLAAQRMIGSQTLTGRIDMTGSGAVAFTTGEPIMVDDEPEEIGELGAYPLVDDDEGELSLAASIKRGFASLVSDENVSRNRYDVLNKKVRRMVNRIIWHHDSLVLSAVGSAVSNTTTAKGAWAGDNSDPYRDILLACAEIDSLNEGFTANTVLLTPIKHAILMSRLATLFPRALGDSSTIENGRQLTVVDGLTILRTTNLPTATDVMVLDRNALGSIGFERLGGGYLGDPSDPYGVETKVKRDDDHDGWKIQVRKTGVPIVQEPAAARKLVGA